MWRILLNCMNFTLNADIHAKLGDNQRFVHAPNNPFGKHLSKDTIHAPTDGRKSGHFQGRLGIRQVQNLELFHFTAQTVGYTTQVFFLFFLFWHIQTYQFCICVASLCTQSK